MLFNKTWLRPSLVVIVFCISATLLHAQTNYINLKNGSSSAGLNDPVLSNASCSEFDGYGGPVPNTPFGNWYAGVLTIGSSDRGVQIMHGYPQYDELYFRGGTNGWQSWRKILNDANFTSFALPLSGGTLTGNITLNTGYELVVNGGANSWGGFAGIASTGPNNGQFRIHGVGVPTMDVYVDGNIYATDQTSMVLHASNFQNYALPLSGGTVNGNVGIGTTNINDATYRLYVEKGIRTRKVKVDQATWPDFVFHPTYRLRPLSEVAQYIQQYQHLPDMPSAEEVKKEGIDLGDNQAMLLKKIEELTLYIIDLNKQVQDMKKKLEEK